ncbi:putative reverse transcriptase domain-containing protein [Tanacetum coccineum]
MPLKSAPMTQAAIRRMINENIDAAIAVERARHVNAGNDARGSRPIRGQDAALASDFGIIECVEGKKVKFAAATLQGPALTWWNAKVATMGLETVNQMPCTEIKQLMTVEFNELALMCLRMVNPERVKVDVYIRGLTDNIKGEVTSSKPANLNEATRMAYKLMEQKSQARDERILEGKKRKWESFQSGNSSGKGYTRNRCPRKVKQEEVGEVCGRDYAIKDAELKGPNVVTGLISIREPFFEIGLMLIELGTFDVIIDMDWLVKHDAIIVCGKKVVHIPYGNRMLIVKSDKGVSRLKVISCIKALKYVKRGCHMFLAHVTEKESKEKRLEDVTVIRDFLEVFPEELPGLPPPRQVEFRIDLVPGAAPVARAPYRLAPYEMKELSVQLARSCWRKDLLSEFITVRVYLVLCVKQEDGLLECVYSKIDMRSRYHQLRIKEEDIPITAFRTRPSGVHVDPTKIESIKSWAALTMPTEEALGTNLDMSTAYHPRTDGQKERTIQTLKDMLCAYVIDFRSSWDRHLPLVRDSQLTGPELIHDMTEKIVQIKKCLLTARSRQKSYADKRAKPLEFEVSDMVLLKVSPWKGAVRFGKRRKLSPRYIGTFKILARVGLVAYTLELPEELKGIHSTFQVLNLKKCLAEGDVIVPMDEIQLDDKLHMI